MESSPYTSGPFSLVTPRAKDGVGSKGRIDADAKLARKALRLLIGSFCESDEEKENSCDGLSLMGVRSRERVMATDWWVGFRETNATAPLVKAAQEVS